ncbi:UNVERIFIED_CONTAM: hypothetical protein K2H54_037990 [Gekko kuhli]
MDSSRHIVFVGIMAMGKDSHIPFPVLDTHIPFPGTDTINFILPSYTIFLESPQTHHTWSRACVGVFKLLLLKWLLLVGREGYLQWLQEFLKANRCLSNKHIYISVHIPHRHKIRFAAECLLSKEVQPIAAYQ